MHTPAPWKVSPYSKEAVYGPDEQAVAFVTAAYRTKLEVDDNLKLILMAPNMLESLVEAAEVIRMNLPRMSEATSDLLAQFQGVIFKASGSCDCDGAPDGGGACLYHRSEEGRREV